MTRGKLLLSKIYKMFKDFHGHMSEASQNLVFVVYSKMNFSNIKISLSLMGQI